MIPVNLAKLAWIVGAKPKWVLNAAARLHQPLDYSESQARWLRLVRVLNHELRIPLSLAGPLASDALERSTMCFVHATASPGSAGSADATGGSCSPRRTTSTRTRSTRHVHLADVRAHGLRLTLDLERNASEFDAALSAAHVFAANKRAGRKQPAPRHAGAAIARAWRLHINVGLLRHGSRRPPAARLALAPGREILNRLLAGRVNFVLVGGVAEYVRGRSSHDDNLAICYDESASNVRRLARVLRDLGARPRFDLDATHDGRPRSPDAVTLGAQGLALVTAYGAIDLRRRVPGIGGYSEAVQQAPAVAAFGNRLRVLSVPGLIAARRTAGGAPDWQVVPVMEALDAVPALEARRRSLGAPGPGKALAPPPTVFPGA